MQLKTSKDRREEGSILGVSLALLGILVVLLAATLELTENQQSLASRAECFEGAFHLAESGIEESISHLNKNRGTGLAAQGWVSDGTNYSKTNSFGGGTYLAKISFAQPPTIVAVGSYPVPNTTNQFISRTITATTTVTSQNSRSVTTKDHIEIDCNSQAAIFDSYDSSDPNYSSNGWYTVSKHKDNGSIATTNGAAAFTMNAGTKIYGTVGTGSGGTVSLSGNAAVGDSAFIAAGNTGIQATHLITNSTSSFAIATLPSASWGVLLSGNTTLGDGYWKVNGNLTVGNGQILTINGTSTLWVTGDVTVSGTGKIVVGSSGKGAIYAYGDTMNFGGGCLDNQTGKPANFAFFGGPLCTYVGVKATGAKFIGTIYAPNAELEMGTGGAGYEFTGGSVSLNVHFNGDWRVHYDEALGGIGPQVGASGAVAIASWNEY